MVLFIIAGNVPVEKLAAINGEAVRRLRQGYSLLKYQKEKTVIVAPQYQNVGAGGAVMIA